MYLWIVILDLLFNMSYGMTNIRRGSRVRDTNPLWPRCNQVGTVVSVQNNTITWRSDYDNQIVTDPIQDMRLLDNGRYKTSRIKRINRNYNQQG